MEGLRIPLERIFTAKYLNGPEGSFFVLLRHFNRGELTEAEFYNLLTSQKMWREIGLVGIISIDARVEGHPPVIINLQRDRYGPLMVSYQDQEMVLEGEIAVGVKRQLIVKGLHRLRNRLSGFTNGGLFNRKDMNWRKFLLEAIKSSQPLMLQSTYDELIASEEK